MIEVPAGGKVIEAVAVHGGGMEVYDIHALEVLQSMIEARAGGETGVSRVEVLAGEAFLKARADGRWSVALAEAAMAAERAAAFRRQPRPAQVTVPRSPRPAAERSRPAGDHALLVQYKDGTRGAVLKLGSSADRWNFACRLAGRDEPLATALVNGPWGNLNLFSALSHAIAHFFRTGQAPYPVERTLLAGGILDAAMHAHHAGAGPTDTPHLEFGYEARDFSAFRETGESWRVVTTDTPQPARFEPTRREADR
jgi:hypothetical protein